MSMGSLVKERELISQSASARNSELHSSSNFFRIAFRSSVSGIPEPLSIFSFRRFRSSLSLRVCSLSSGGSTSLIDLKISSRLISDDRDSPSGWRRAGPWRSGRSRLVGARRAVPLQNTFRDDKPPSPCPLPPGARGRMGGHGGPPLRGNRRTTEGGSRTAPTKKEGGQAPEEGSLSPVANFRGGLRCSGP